MVVSEGAIAWAGQDRTVWIVLSMTEGIAVRPSKQPWDENTLDKFPIGKVSEINAHGLISANVELTDEEWAMVVKARLMHNV